MGNFSKINIKSDKVCINNYGTSINSIYEFLRGLEIDADVNKNTVSVNIDSSLITPTVGSNVPKLMDMFYCGIISTLKNGCVPSVQSALNVNASVNIDVDCMLQGVLAGNTFYGAFKTSILDIDECPVIEVCCLNQNGLTYSLSTKKLRHEIEQESFKTTFIPIASTFLYRIAPTIDIIDEESKKTSVVSSQIFHGTGFTDGAVSNLTFQIGTKSGQYTEWRRITSYYMSNKDSISIFLRKASIQIAELTMCAASSPICYKTILDTSTNKIYNMRNYTPLFLIKKHATTDRDLFSYFKSSHAHYLYEGKVYKLVDGRIIDETGNFVELATEVSHPSFQLFE